MTDYSFTAKDGTSIYAAKWVIENPQGIVQLFHGMAEHIGRYDEFARYLNSRGYIVAGEDHRGHGKTVGKTGTLGYFADRDGWNKLIEDNVVLGERLRSEHPNIPYYVIAQSMGVFLIRKLVVDFPNGIDKMVFLSSGDLPDFQVTSLTILGYIQRLFLSNKKKAKLIDKLSFSKLNTQFEPGKTGFEWLTRDEKVIEEYLNDPDCGFVATHGMYKDIAYGMNYLKKDDAYIRTPNTLPILLYSGSNDALGANGKLVESIAEKYRSHGCTEVEIQFNPGGRHESLHEINKDEVFCWLADWLDK